MSQEPSRKIDYIRRLKITGIVVLLVLVGLGIAATQYPPFWGLPKRFAVVDEGVLYRSAQPKTHQIDNLMEEYGIRTIMIVREGSSRKVPDEAEHAQKRGLQVVHIPIKSRQPIPDDQVQEFFACVDNKDVRPILIHCSAGRHRTGYLCALYRIERQGWSLQDAIDEMMSFGFADDTQIAVLEQLKAYKPGTWAKDAPTPGKAANETAPPATQPDDSQKPVEAAAAS